MVMGACPGQITISCVPLSLMVTATTVRACRYNKSKITKKSHWFKSKINGKNHWYKSKITEKVTGLSQNYQKQDENV